MAAVRCDMRPSECGVFAPVADGDGTEQTVVALIVGDQGADMVVKSAVMLKQFGLYERFEREA